MNTLSQMFLCVLNAARFDPFFHFLGKFCMFLTELKLKDRQGSEQKLRCKKVLTPMEHSKHVADGIF